MWNQRVIPETTWQAELLYNVLHINAQVLDPRYTCVHRMEYRDSYVLERNDFHAAA